MRGHVSPLPPSLLDLRIANHAAFRELAEALKGGNVKTVLEGQLAVSMEDLMVRDVCGHHVGDRAFVPSKDVRSARSLRGEGAKRTDAAILRIELIKNINTSVVELVGIFAEVTKNVAGTSGTASKTAQDAADFAKFIPGGVGAVFQLLALSVRVVVMFAEADRE